MDSDCSTVLAAPSRELEPNSEGFVSYTWYLSSSQSYIVYDLTCSCPDG